MSTIKTGFIGFSVICAFAIILFFFSTQTALAACSDPSGQIACNLTTLTLTAPDTTFTDGENTLSPDYSFWYRSDCDPPSAGGAGSYFHDVDDVRLYIRSGGQSGTIVQTHTPSPENAHLLEDEECLDLTDTNESIGIGSLANGNYTLELYTHVNQDTHNGQTVASQTDRRYLPFTVNRTVNYNFTGSKNISSAGTLSSSPSGISCGTSCSSDSGSYSDGTSVTITATPASGYSVTGWNNQNNCGNQCTKNVAGNGASGTATCSITKDRHCRAIFTAHCGDGIDNDGDGLTDTADPGCANPSDTTEGNTWRTLTVSKSPSNAGTVTGPVGDDNGISCGSNCSERYNNNSSVQITANAGAGKDFSYWSGNCSGSNNPLSVTMSSNKSCTANFIDEPVVENGQCGPAARNYLYTETSYTESYCSAGTVDRANPTFPPLGQPSTAYWACNGSGGGSNQTCYASRDAAPINHTLTVTKAGGGAGTVSAPVGNENGISCGSNCSETYPENTLVTVSHSETAPNNFSGWSGACSGTGACQVNMSTDRSVTATFGTCGDGIVNGTEQCDLGAGNGACPSLCSASCTDNTTCGPPSVLLEARNENYGGTGAYNATEIEVLTDPATNNGRNRLKWTLSQGTPTSCTSWAVPAHGGWDAFDPGTVSGDNLRANGADREYFMQCTNSFGDSPIDSVQVYQTGEIRVISEDQNGDPLPSTWTISGTETVAGISGTDVTTSWLRLGVGYAVTGNSVTGYGTPTVSPGLATLSTATTPLTFTLTYTAVPQISVDLITTPSSIADGGSSSLSWDVQGGWGTKTCTATSELGDWTGSPTWNGGPDNVSPTPGGASYWYRLECTDSSGTHSDTESITVSNPLSCAPTNHADVYLVGGNAFANFSGSGGDGTHTWTSSGGSPSPHGPIVTTPPADASTYDVVYTSTGSKTVTLEDSSDSVQCNVEVIRSDCGNNTCEEAGGESCSTCSDDCTCPLTECNDGIDNDLDGTLDEDDNGCWIDPNDPGTYDPLDDSELEGTRIKEI